MTLISSQKQKIDYLDSIRGLACLIVARNHFVLAFDCLIKDTNLASSFYGHHFFRLFSDGRFAVFIFFVLSGRVICDSFYRSGKSSSIYSAMIRRPFRLGLPIFGAFMFVYFLEWINYMEIFGYTQNQTCKSWWATWIHPPKVQSLSSLTSSIIQDLQFLGSTPYQAGVLWTIPHELQNSYVVYVIALITKNLKTGKYLFPFIMLFYFFWVKSLAFLFTFGFVMCMLENDGYFDIIKRPTHIVFKIVFIALKFFIIKFIYELYIDGGYYNTFESVYINPFRINGNNPFTPENLDLTLGLMAAVLLLVISLSTISRTILSAPPLVFLGKVSFGVYLAHGPVLPLCEIAIHKLIAAGYSASASLLITEIVVLFPLAIFLGWIIYKLFDKPSVNLAFNIYNSLFVVGLWESLKDIYKKILASRHIFDKIKETDWIEKFKSFPVLSRFAYQEVKDDSTLMSEMEEIPLNHV